METNGIWTQLFQDEPVSETILNKLHTEIMQSVLAQPVNFAEEIALAARRKVGIILAASLLLVGLGFGIFVWFEGNVLKEILTQFLIFASGILPLGVFENAWLYLSQKIMFAENLQMIFQYVWLQYSWQIIGCGILFLMILGSFRSSHRHISTSD